MAFSDIDVIIDVCCHHLLLLSDLDPYTIVFMICPVITVAMVW
jgi:hypothetical protein